MVHHTITRLSAVIILLLCSRIAGFAQAQDTLQPDLAPFSPSAAPQIKAEDVQMQVDKQATFPGGNQNINPFIAKNIVYPPEAIAQGIEGRVTVSFTITKEGKVTDVKVRKPVHPLLDEAAINIIKKMPQWEPAMFKNEPVNTLYTIPINFKLQ